MRPTKAKITPLMKLADLADLFGVCQSDVLATIANGNSGFPRAMRPLGPNGSPRWDSDAVNEWAKTNTITPDDCRDTRVALYRHYDANGGLLYVGVSVSVMKRLVDHRQRSHWTRKICRIDVEWFDTRQEALAAESKAIATERPAFNLAGRWK